MTNVRIKDLTSATPAGTESVPFDSASPGTRQNTITSVVDVGNQTISNPLIGVSNTANLSTVRTNLAISGNLTTLTTSSAFFGTTTVAQQDVIFFVSGAIGGKDGSSRKMMLVGGDFAVSGNMFAFKSASFTDTIIVPTPTTGTAATNKNYVDYPSVRLVTGATDTIVVADFGNVVAYTVTGAVNININNSLTASFPANKTAIILLQFENSASAPFLSSSGGVTLNGVTTTYTSSIGPGLLSISSRNGLNWFR